MATIAQVIEGLVIIGKYEKGDVAADHDVIWAGSGPETKVLKEDRDKLRDLGWFYDKKFEGWKKFV